MRIHSRVLLTRSVFVWWAGLLALAIVVVPIRSVNAATSSSSLAVSDPHRQVRATLEDGVASRETLQMLLQNPSLPGGLRGEILEQMQSPKEALDHYRAALTAPGRSQSAARLRAARLADAQGQTAFAIQAWEGVLQDPVWAREVLVFAEALEALQQHSHLAQSARLLIDPQGRFPGARLSTPADSLRREAYAQALVHLLDASPGPAESAWIHRRLYIDLPESAAARKIKAKSAAVVDDKSPEIRLARARNLSARHDNKAVLDTLQGVSASKTWKQSERCEAKYLLGKAARKMRRYKSARKYLKPVTQKCPEPWRKNARYLLARLASFSGGKKSAKTMESFLTAYPDDRFTDDVLMWKAKALVQKKKYGSAEQVFRTILEQHADGDMHKKAQFELAFLLAREGRVADARKILATVADNDKEKVFFRDQARYWRGRLLLYPQWSSWKLNADETSRTKGTRFLTELATERPASFYGNLAAQVLSFSSQEAGNEAAPIANATSGQTPSTSPAELTFSPALTKQEAFQSALVFLESGYDREAALLLDSVERQHLVDGDRVAMTEMYARARARDRSHRLLRESGYALPAGKPESANALLWSLAYPMAHARAIRPAAQEFQLPPPLLFGLAREESAFEAEVVSWAGAIGLCQLMPFTAREEAERLRVPLASLDALRKPTLNARLGAAHLSRRMSLGHPLLAIAAYNAGPGNVNKWRKALPDLPLDAFVESIPVEQTRNYVKKVTGSWVVYTWMTGQGTSRGVEYALELPKRR